MEKQVIELAPLAYMRGRTLNESFIILDEAQNTTAEQMKMFLTRIGFGSTAVITGDITQIDLPRTQSPACKQAMEVLHGRRRHQLHPFHAAGRRAPPAGAAHRRGLRAHDERRREIRSKKNEA